MANLLLFRFLSEYNAATLFSFFIVKIILYLFIINLNLSDTFSLFLVIFISDTIQTWTLEGTLTGLAIVLSLYLVLVLKVLPAYMKNREPLKLNNIMLKYNAFQVAFSLYLVAIVSIFVAIRFLVGVCISFEQCCHFVHTSKKMS